VRRTSGHALGRHIGLERQPSLPHGGDRVAQPGIGQEPFGIGQADAAHAGVGEMALELGEGVGGEQVRVGDDRVREPVALADVIEPCRLEDRVLADVGLDVHRPHDPGGGVLRHELVDEVVPADRPVLTEIVGDARVSRALEPGVAEPRQVPQMVVGIRHRQLIRVERGPRLPDGGHPAHLRPLGSRSTFIRRNGEAARPSLQRISGE
jgi:hypothetical protein